MGGEAMTNTWTGELPLRVVRTGIAVPERVETAAELSPRIGRSVDWILERTGVAERRISEPDAELAELAADAARQAADGELPDLLIFAAAGARQALPDTSIFVAQALGWEGIPVQTVHASCASFLVALHSAAAHLAAGTYGRILIVSAEMGSKVRNLEEPESAALLGDGAGAVWVERPEGGSPEASSPGGRLLRYRMEAWPSGAGLTEVRGGGLQRHPNHPGTTPSDNLFHMDGPSLYKFTRRRFASFTGNFFGPDFGPGDVDMLVPHQASARAFSVFERMGFPKERVVRTLDRFGNCASASVPMALATANAEGRLQRGDRVLLFATAAGVSISGMLFEW